jgi:hypothetical protein
MPSARAPHVWIPALAFITRCDPPQTGHIPIRQLAVSALMANGNRSELSREGKLVPGIKVTITSPDNGRKW